MSTVHKKRQATIFTVNEIASLTIKTAKTDEALKTSTKEALLSGARKRNPRLAVPSCHGRAMNRLNTHPDPN